MDDGIRFFLVGSGRSGTTLLRALVDSHPLVAVPPESAFFSPLVRRRARLEGPDGVAVDALRWYLLQTPTFAEWAMSADEIDAAWTPRPRDVPAALDALYLAYAHGRGKALVGDKTPHHVRVMPMLARSFPRARFVHIIRDGRDVAASLAAAHFGPSSFAHAADVWRQNVEAGRTAGAALGDRYLELRYEAVVADTEGEMRRLCSFLDVPYDDGMLRYHERADEVLAGFRRQDHLQKIRRPPTPGRSWEEKLSPRQVQVFQALAGDLATSLGYPEGAAPTRAVQVEVRLLRRWWALGVRVRRRRKRLGSRLGWRPESKAIAMATTGTEAARPVQPPSGS